MDVYFLRGEDAGNMGEDILVVDDEQAIADLVEVYLNNEGFSVHKFYNGRDALECVGAMQLKLAILDVMLPDIDGDEVLRQFAAHGQVPDVYFMTGYEDILPLEEMDRLGAKGYFIKPILVDKIKGVLEMLQ
jgi:two-component system response regulator VanR